MKNLFLVAALIVAGGLTFVSRNLLAGPTTAPTTAPSTQPINKYCAIMRDEKIDPNVTIVHDGKTIGFCCKDCIKDFKADPDKHLKDLK